MIKHSLIIMPFQLPWDWSADYQRQTCMELSKNNLVIAYIQKDACFLFKQRQKSAYPKIRNILFYRPLYPLPFRRVVWIEQLNQMLNIIFIALWFGFRKKKILLWIFDPYFRFYPTIRKFFRNMITLYDCVDFHTEINPEKALSIHNWEKTLIMCVDYFFVNSHTLFTLHFSTRIPDAIVQQGFRYDDFIHPKVSYVLFPKDIPVIGFVGGINHRLDFQLIHELIRHNQQWFFVFWGKAQEVDEFELSATRRMIHTIKKYSNVTMGYSQDCKEIPGIIRQFDMGIIPYDTKLDFVRHSYPMKLFEYFYMGKPVISTPIEELKRFPKFVKIVDSVQEWEEAITTLLAKSWPQANMLAQKHLAIANSWEKKIQKMMRVIEYEK